MVQKTFVQSSVKGNCELSFGHSSDKLFSRYGNIPCIAAGTEQSNVCGGEEEGGMLSRFRWRITSGRPFSTDAMGRHPGRCPPHQAHSHRLERAHYRRCRLGATPPVSSVRRECRRISAEHGAADGACSVYLLSWNIINLTTRKMEVIKRAQYAPKPYPTFPISTENERLLKRRISTEALMYPARFSHAALN